MAATAKRGTLRVDICRKRDFIIRHGSVQAYIGRFPVFIVQPAMLLVPFCVNSVFCFPISLPATRGRIEFVAFVMPAIEFVAFVMPAILLQIEKKPGDL